MSKSCQKFVKKFPSNMQYKDIYLWRECQFQICSENIAYI